MARMTKYILFIVTLVLAGRVYAGPFEGKAFILDPGGNELTLGGYEISGNIDLDAMIMSVDTWGPFFGLLVVTNDIELLEPGSYTRTAGDVTVPPGHVGAHMEVEWGVTPIYVYMVWEVNGPVFEIIDSDGDGIPGHAMNNGPFPNFTAYYEFTADDTTGPYVLLDIDTNGTNHECVDGAAEVTMTAITQLLGGAVLDSVSWFIDGEAAGTGISITETLALGAHTIEATALTTTGQSDTESAAVEVEDTTRPVVTVAFLDNQGNDVSSAGAGQIEISIEASDSCDANPVITSSTATPTTDVADGDKLSINASLNNLKLPTTAINVSATAKDASGNFSLTTDQSSRTLLLE